jgi:hypothetical protein
VNLHIITLTREIFAACLTMTCSRGRPPSGFISVQITIRYELRLIYSARQAGGSLISKLFSPLLGGLGFEVEQSSCLTSLWVLSIQDNLVKIALNKLTALLHFQASRESIRITFI